MTKRDELDPYRIHGLPHNAYYIPNFISPQEEEEMLSQIYAARKPKWATLANRRLQCWPAILSKGNVLLAEKLPHWLGEPFVKRMKDSGLWEGSTHNGPNHVLINEYLPGQGIFPHEDGNAYYPVVCTISIGSAIVLDIYEKETERSYRVFQEPRSLYKDYLHGISESLVDENLTPTAVANWANLSSDPPQTINRTTRLSLTYRDVMKVARIPSLGTRNLAFDSVTRRQAQ